MNCTITHQGKTFQSGGAVVTPDYCVGYVGAQPDNQTEGAQRTLTDWHGATIGTIRLTSTWRTPRSYVSSRMYQAYAVVDGVTYTGRTCGTGMIFKGKRVKS